MSSPEEALDLLYLYLPGRGDSVGTAEQHSVCLCVLEWGRANSMSPPESCVLGGWSLLAPYRQVH